MKVNSKNSALKLFLIFISFFSTNIFAKETQKLDRLIVSDTRLDQNNIEDLPLNISVITVEDINLSPAKTIPRITFT